MSTGNVNRKQVSKDSSSSCYSIQSCYPYSIIFTARERTKGKGSGQGNNKSCQFHSGMSPSKKELILKTGPF